VDFPSTHLEVALPGIADVPVIGIVRRLPPRAAVEAVKAAFDSGLRWVEVTLDSENALQLVALLRRQHAGIGVGSVVRPSQVSDALEAGAQFVVSPLTSSELIRAALESGLPVLPGAATPTEIDLAMRAGATAVKVFPARQLGGPGYIRAVMSPLGDPPLVPTGGVTADTAADYLKAGAVAVGAGSDLFSSTAIAERGIRSVAERTAEWIRAVT
jgi:2-dehydro-3-deoxyphosphogluconate aldolase/(4S)-4-hydroxy-2-oxoglutarate aldolase